MATYRIEKFDFSKPERWIKRFERFREASDLAEKSEVAQISTLVYSMGEKAEDLLQSFNLSEANAKKYSKVKESFESYFVKRRNTIYERAKFNLRKQEEGKTVEVFITDLYSLVEYCEYGDLRDELVRDRIVVGIRDKTLSEKLQMTSDLTLENAVTQERQKEAVSKQQSEIRGVASAEKTIEEVKSSPSPRGRQQTRSRNQSNQSAKTTTTPQCCTRCGKAPPHGRLQCPEREAICHKCHKKGHYKACCKSKTTITEVNLDSQDSEEEAFLGAIGTEAGSQMAWTANVQLNGRLKEFMIDTGADVMVIPEAAYDRDRDRPLNPTERILSGPTQNTLTVCGKFRGLLSRNGIESQQDIYVVSHLRKPLLGRPAIEALNVVSLVEPVQESNILRMFPEVFSGLGKLKGNYEIKLKDRATPFALTTPRRVAVPLLPKVKKELQRMEGLGVITRIEEPTEWCAGMVVVAKPEGRKGEDLCRLNYT